MRCAVEARGKDAVQWRSLEVNAVMPAIKRRKSFWRDEVIPAVENELDIFAEEGIRTTLRAMFYRLYSRGYS